jgi:hypothetical protein
MLTSRQLGRAPCLQKSRMMNLHTPLCGLSITLIWQDSGLDSLFSRLSILRALKIDKSN